MKVSVNDFVRRQIKGSGKTYSHKLSFEEIADHAKDQLKKGCYKIGYREGILIVSVDNSILKYFKCPLVKINQTSRLISKMVKRRDHEQGYIQTRIENGKYSLPSKVELILYSNSVLTENNENSSDSDWELISINSYPEGVKYLPMKPVTMMRNQLELEGGTKAFYSSKEWAESILFWQKYASIHMENESI